MRSPSVEPSHTVEALEWRMHLTATPTVPPARSVADGGPGLVHALAHLSSIRVSPIALTVDDKAIFAGSKSGPEDAADVYDDTTGAWTAGKLSLARWQMGVTVAGGKAIYAGGATGDNIGNPFDPSKVVDIFNGANGRWSTAKLSVARWSIAAATAGNTAIFAGGFTAPNQMSGVIDLYDADTGHWSTAKLSQLRSGVASASVGDLALFAGGSRLMSNGQVVSSNVVDIYNSATGKWSTAQLSQARLVDAVAVVDGKVLFAGGFDGDGNFSNTVDIFDSGTNRWSSARLSRPRDYMGSAVVDGQAIFAGGYAGSDSSFFPIYEDSVDIYDAAHGTWSTATLSQPGANYSAATTGDKALFAGADVLTSENTLSDVVEAYDARTGRWSTTTLSAARTLIGATSVGSKALFAAGNGNAETFDIVDVFTSDDTPPTARLVSAPTLRNSARFYTFTVSYHDNIRIDAKRLDNGDIVVTGPNGFKQHAELISQSRGGRGSNRAAIYAIRGPGGRWDTSDNGVYTLHLQGGEVKDLAGNYAISDRIGRFKVTIPTSLQSLSLPTAPAPAIPFQAKRKIDDLLET